MVNIKYFAEEMIKKQSFLCSSFAEAKDIIKISDKFIEYDRITLIDYSHNLCADEYKLFLRELCRLGKEKNVSREEEKMLKEYYALFYYVQNNSLMATKIQKETRPDFVLTLENGSRWGIEETELTTPNDKVLGAIMRDFSGTKLTEEEIKRRAIEKHGEKANNYQIRKYGKTLTIGSGMFSINSRKELFAQKILTKYIKYKGMIDEFDKFVILCDAIQGYEVTSQQDVEDIFDLIYDKISHENVEISILAFVDNKIACFTKKML